MIRATEIRIMIHQTETRVMIHPTGTRDMNGDHARKGIAHRSVPTIRVGATHNKETRMVRAKELPGNAAQGWGNASNHHKGDLGEIMETAAGVINHQTETASRLQAPKS